MTTKSRRSNRRGAAAVELAVILPLLVLLAGIGLDFARVYYFAQVVSNAARVGAMYESDPDVADKSPYETTEAAVQAITAQLQPPPQVKVGEGLDKAGNQYAEVTVTYDYKLVTQWAGLPTKMPLESTARARLYRAEVIDRENP